MANAYRSILRTDPDIKNAETLILEVEAWLAEKKCKPGFTGSYTFGRTKFSHFEVDNSEFSAMRWQIDEIWDLGTKYEASPESERHGISTVTLVKTLRDLWIWVEVDAPIGRWKRPDGQVSSGPAHTEAPRVLRSIIDNCEVTDGLGAILSSPLVVASSKHLAELIEVLEDDSRYSAVFVSAPPIGTPPQDWAVTIAGITDRAKGLASTYVLDSAAQAKFTELIGFKHSVQPGSMRTFLPGVKPFDLVDAYRHKLLSSSKLQAENFRQISKMLMRAQVSRLSVAKLPRVLLEADQALNRARRFENRPFELLEGLRSPKSSESETFASEREHEKADKAIAVDEVAKFWEQVAEEYAAENATLKIAIEDTKSAYQFIDELNSELASVAIDRIRQEDLIKTLRNELTKLGSTDAFVIEVAEKDSTIVPESAEQLLNVIDNVPYICFMGDREPAIKLDDSPNIFPGLVKLWETILALSAYAARKKSGSFNGGIKQYMESTSHDGMKVSGIKWRESESVLNNPKLEKQRRLRVPLEVDNSGEITLVAHIAFASKAQNYPRMYFFDALHTDLEKIIIGYIGEHLDNTLTN